MLKVIASTQTLLSGSYDYIENKIGISHYPSKILQATRYWIDWNLRASEFAEFSYKIENISSCWPHIAELLDLDTAQSPFHLLPTDSNARSHREIFPAEIASMDRPLFEELRSVAFEFGYSLRI